MNFLCTVLSVLAVSGAATAQATTSVQSPSPTTTPSWYVPFHADGDGTLWAAGPSYKLAVGETVTFYPVVGAEQAHLPWRWRSQSLRLGTQELLAHAPAAAAAAPRAAGFRVEIDRGALVEIYGARPEGVEQSFAIPRPPVLGGDLELVGVVEGLAAPDRQAAHASLTFHDVAGRAVVEYGAATAIDALGRRLAMTTAFAGGRVHLRVPAGWLAEAAWPVTIDPLVARVGLVGSGVPAGPPQVVRARSQDRLFVAETRAVAAGDHDLIVRCYTDNWTYLGVVYSEIGMASVRDSSLAISTQTDRLVVAAGMEQPLQHWVRVYVHAAGSLAANSGTVLDVPVPGDAHDSVPSVGGSATRYCYLAFRRDERFLPGNSQTSEVFGVRIDTQAETLAAAQNLHTLAGSDYDAEGPRVSEFSEAGGWLVVWQEFDNSTAGDDWDVVSQRIAADGSLAGGRILGQGTQTWLHKLTPHVAGSGSRFAITWVGRDNDGTKTTAEEGTGVYVQRVTWSAGGTATLGVVHGIDIGAVSPVLRLSSSTRRMSFDHITDSLWAVAWDRLDTNTLHVARFGFDARVAERATLAGPPAAGAYATPSLAFDDEGLRFPVVFASAGVVAGNPVYGDRFAHGPAQTVAYGAGCAGTIDAYNAGAGSRPFAGCELFGIRLQSGRANALTVLVAGVAPANLPLPSAGAGCRLLVDPAQPLVALPPTVTDGTGEVAINLPIPSRAAGVDLCWQFVQVDLAQLWSSNGLVTNIR